MMTPGGTYLGHRLGTRARPPPPSTLCIEYRVDTGERPRARRQIQSEPGGLF